MLLIGPGACSSLIKKECNATETTEPATDSAYSVSSTLSSDVTATAIPVASSETTQSSGTQYVTTTTVSVASSGTTQSSGTTKKHKNRQENTKEVLELAVVGLAVAVTVTAILILLVTGYMVKQKLSKSKINQSKPTADENNSRESKTTVITGHLNPKALWLFEGSDQIYSRPPSSTSIHEMPPTNDLRRLYDKPAIQPVLFYVKQQHFHSN